MRTRFCGRRARLAGAVPSRPALLRQQRYRTRKPPLGTHAWPGLLACPQRSSSPLIFEGGRNAQIVGSVPLSLRAVHCWLQAPYFLQKAGYRTGLIGKYLNM